MPLTPAHETLLYELYQVSHGDTTYVSGNFDQIGPSGVGDIRMGLKTHLQTAITQINQNTAQAGRVTAILEEYDSLALDRTQFDGEGIKYRPAKNLKAIQEALYPYTGIWLQSSQVNRVSLG